VAGIRTSTISFLSIISNISLLVAIAIYRKFLILLEIRTVIKYSFLVSLVSYIISFIYASRLNLILGIPDLYMIVIWSCLNEVVTLGMLVIPTLSLFAKITPNHIEATMFAFLGGLFNLSRYVLSPFIGNIYNAIFI
jgi:hypothetical protein